MKRPLILLIALGLLVPHGRAAAGGGVDQSTRFHRNVVGKTVEITLRNYEQGPVELIGSWTITDVRSGQQVSHYNFTKDQRELRPGAELVWDWMQDDACYGVCTGGPAGEPAGAGVYEASVETSLGVSTHRFQIGRYFTAAFRCGETDCGWPDFVVYVNTPDEVARMEAEAAAAEKTLIVSGIVRRQRPYNRNWRFSMGPGSIVLGEVFIEVCDGSPRYVQRHRSDWLGDRWCPWSSYVEKVGR